MRHNKTCRVESSSERGSLLLPETVLEISKSLELQATSLAVKFKDKGVVGITGETRIHKSCRAAYMSATSKGDVALPKDEGNLRRMVIDGMLMDGGVSTMTSCAPPITDALEFTRQ